jgi:hypothetical protein
VLIFVSWDNKHYGTQNYNWNAWDTNYFMRHLAKGEVYLRRNWLAGG